MKKEKNSSRNENLPDSEACLRKAKNTFPHLTEAELRTLFNPETIRVCPKGELLYEEGNRIKGCYFVYSGIIKIYQTSREGKVQIIRFSKEKDIFGFRSVIRHETACTSAKTFSDCILYHIPDKNLLDLLQNNPGFAYDMVQIACKELGDANRYLQDIAQKSVKARLAKTLWLLADEFGKEADGTLRLNITREELGNFIGTATETVIRLLSDYKAEGLVESKGRKIRLLDIEKLKTVAGL